MKKSTKKILAVAASLTLGAALCFSGCIFGSSGSTPSTTNPPASGQQTPTPSAPETTSITFEEFMQDYSDKATKFVKDEVQPKVVLGKTVQSESWYIAANSSDELTQVTIVYTYNVDETKRAVEIATVTLTPIDLDAIVDGTYDLTNNGFKIERSTVFEFDAKTNYDNQDILNALYKADRNATSAVKVYNEVESSDADYRSFDIVKLANNKISVDNIYVQKGNGSEDDLLYFLSTSYGKSVTTKSSVEIGGTNIYSTSYELEEIEDEPEESEEPEEPENIDLAAALDEFCKEDLVNRCLLGFTNLSLDKVSDGTWYVSKDADGKITSAEYAFNYADANNAHYYTVGKVVFNSPVSAQDLQAGNLGNTTYSRAYRTSYDPTIQADRADLTNAICDTVFGTNADATRIVVDRGATTDPSLGQIGRFDVIQITENGVEQASIEIKYSTTDASYISKLENESNYNVATSSSYQFEGQKV